MGKEAVWRHHAEEWQGILKKNLILKAANLGVTTALLDVGDKEMDLERILTGQGHERDVDASYIALSESLNALVALTKKLIDKHRNTFAEPCQHIAVYRNAAEHRKPAALQEVKAFRQTVANGCHAAGGQLANAPDVPHLLQVWGHFLQYLEQHSGGIHAMHTKVGQCKQATKVGELDQLKGLYVKLAHDCENAAKMS